MQSQFLSIIEQLRGKLIVSCQALPDEPFFGTNFIVAMAKAAILGGAGGLRINSPEDIKAVRNALDDGTKIPIIGIYKMRSPDSEVYITPTFDAARKIIEAGCDIVALDATERPRPGGETLAEIIHKIHQNYSVPVMADVSTCQEGIMAESYGADLIATTLAGYTPYSRPAKENEPDLQLISELVNVVKVPVIAEGRISTPQFAVEAFKKGAYAVVVGSAITRPHKIVSSFVKAITEYFDSEVKR